MSFVKGATVMVSSVGLFVVFIIPSIHSVGIHKEDSEFCYSDPECGPGSDHWGDLCQSGYRQSPISLPIQAHRLPGVFGLDLHSYKAGAFRMQNNGHTVHIELLETPDDNANSIVNGGTGHPFGTKFAFPDPLALGKRVGNDDNSKAYYKFDSAHFHWGLDDGIGSEHCFEDRCFAMELHLVHHLNVYDSMAEALDSGDPNALAVIGIVLDVTPAAGQGNPALAPIINNIFQIEEPSHEEWVYINHPLDFTPLMVTKGQNYMYSYKGSLTTPDCNEQVNWFVFKRPIAISHRDVNGFRFIRDNKGEELSENHRPLQKRNGRQIFLSAVKPI